MTLLSANTVERLEISESNEGTLESIGGGGWMIVLENRCRHRIEGMRESNHFRMSEMPVSNEGMPGSTCRTLLERRNTPLRLERQMVCLDRSCSSCSTPNPNSPVNSHP